MQALSAGHTFQHVIGHLFGQSCMQIQDLEYKNVCKHTKFLEVSHTYQVHNYIKKYLVCVKVNGIVTPIIHFGRSMRLFLATGVGII